MDIGDLVWYPAGLFASIPCGYPRVLLMSSPTEDPLGCGLSSAWCTLNTCHRYIVRGDASHLSALCVPSSDITTLLERPDNHSITTVILQKLHQYKAKVKLVWIPSYKGIPGNEFTDSIAKVV